MNLTGCISKLSLPFKALVGKTPATALCPAGCARPSAISAGGFVSFSIYLNYNNDKFRSMNI